MGFGNDVGRDVFDQLTLCLERVLAVGGQTEPFADPKNMRVHRHGGLIPDDRADYVRRFASNALEGLKVIDVIGHDAVEGGDETLCHLNEVFGFGAGITDRFDVFEDLIGGSCGQGFGCGVRRKEGRGDHVHPFVGALGGEHHRHEALEGIREVQLTLRYRHIGFKPTKNGFKELFFIYYLVIYHVLFI